MGTPGPHGNWRGYLDADLTYKVGNLHGKDIFLVHGVGKDLAHYEQSMLLAKALVEDNVLFRQQVSNLLYFTLSNHLLILILSFRFIHMMMLCLVRL